MSRSPAAPKDPIPALAMSGKSWLLLGVLSLIWGSGFLFTRIAVRDIPPATLIGVRVATSAVILYALIRARGVPMPAKTWQAWRPFWVMGLLNTALPFTLNAWGLIRIESGLAGILTATTPIFTVVTAHFATKDERFSPPVALGIGIGMVGAIAILGGDPASLGSGSGLAKLAVLAASLLYGVSGVFARSLRGTPPLIMTWAQMSTATVLLLPLVVRDRPWETATWSSDALISTAVLTLVSTVTAYLLYFRILIQAGAVNASLVAYVIPGIAVLLGVTFLDETLLGQHVAGMALILAAMGLIDGRLARWLASRRVAPADLPAD